MDAVGSYTDYSISTISPSFGGSERESIESIKFNAPKTFAAQKRAVTAEDYKALIYQNFSDEIDQRKKENLKCGTWL